MTENKVIWLQPWCEKCQSESWGSDCGRQWCEDDVWTDCYCGAKPVKYALCPQEITND